MKQERSHRAHPDIHYQLPVVVRFCGDNLPGTLTVARHADGEFWEGRLFVRPKLHVTIEQFATPINGGFGLLSDNYFLDHVRLVFDFSGGADFDFVSDDGSANFRFPSDADDYRPSNLG